MPKKKEAPDPVKHSLATLFDLMLKKFELKNDAALARALELAPPEISKHRRGIIPCGARIILRIHEKLDIPVAVIRSHMVEMPA